jgi:isopenicillin-N epimerase
MPAEPTGRRHDRTASGPTTRRRFLGGVLPAALAWPAALDALATRLAHAGTQDVWDLVRDAFLIPDDRIYLNVGTLGAQPRAVVDAVIEHTRRVAETFPPATDWDGIKTRLASLLNADAAGFVFPRNTTEGMSFVANGLELRAGDEILTTDHEHIGGLCMWQLAARRHGLTLHQLPLPAPAATDDEVIALFRRAITPRTRVISISHVTFTTGSVLPVRAIVRLCREHDIICVVDGAHPPGLMRVDLRALDPDFYASSPHKWLLAPQGTGFLWMREEWRTRLWPTLASGGWDDLTLGAHRFNHLGTLDESRLAGLDAALRFHETIGSDRIHARLRALRQHLIIRLAANPRVRIVSATDDGAAGMVSFQVDDLDSLELQRRLADVELADGRRVRIRTRVIGEYDYGWMRLSPHIYNSIAELDATALAIEQAGRG